MTKNIKEGRCVCKSKISKRGLDPCDTVWYIETSSGSNLVIKANIISTAWWYLALWGGGDGMSRLIMGIAVHHNARDNRYSN